eukprot:g4179.t1
MSGFNDYAVVLDVDGNGWSDRLPVLLRGDAVILKQEYNRHLDYLTEIAKQSDAITSLIMIKVILKHKLRCLYSNLCKLLT